MIGRVKTNFSLLKMVFTSIHRHAAGALLLACNVVSPAWAGTENWKNVSDVLVLGLPALAAAHTIHSDDSDGLKQLTWTLGSTLGSTLLLKSQIHATRPNKADDESFPSGHTAIVFASARYMHKRYAESVNPYLLYGAAGLTAFARVKAKEHHWRDTVAGAALGYAWAEFLTGTRTGASLTAVPEHGGMKVVWQRPW